MPTKATKATKTQEEQEQIQSNIKDTNSVLKLTLMLDYRKAKKKFDEGSRNIDDFASWMITTKTHTIREYASSANTDKFIQDLIDMRDKMKALTDDDSIGYKSRLTTSRLRDGQGTIHAGMYASWQVMKDDKAIARYIRLETKKEIDRNFNRWRRENSLDMVNSSILPKKLFDDILGGHITWEFFCEELYETRVKQDLKLRDDYVIKEAKARAARAERIRVIEESRKAFNIKHGYPEYMLPYQRKGYNLNTGRTNIPTKESEDI